MRRRVAWLVFALCSVVFPVSSATAEQPNFVLIFADDLGINDLNCYGRREHSTPNLDRLAAKGVRYTSAYCGLSICSASRASLMTGKSPARLHLTSYLPGRPDTPAQKVLNARIHSALPPEERTLAEELMNAGYRTGLFGKWHLGGNASSASNQGFEETFEPAGNGALNEVEGSKNEFAIANKAAAFIRSASDKPCFCYLPHHSPHIRVDATPDAMEKNAKAFNPVYAANIESLDKSVGIVLRAIEEQPSQRETFILFASDNGGLHVPEGHPEPMTHNTPFRAGKGYLYEGGVRIPLIVASSKQSVAPNRVEDGAVSLMDLMPSFLRLAGVSVDKTQGPLDGIDISDHWTKNAKLDAEREFYWNFPHYTNQGSRPAAAIRKGKWKLVMQYEDGSNELYDLENDLGESRNVAATNPDKATELRGKLDAWLLRVGAQRSDPNPQYDPETHAAIYQEFDSSSLRASAAPSSEEGNFPVAHRIGEDWKAWRQRMNQAAQNRKPLLKKPEGAVTLFASQAKTHGKNLRYEPEPQKNVLGYWTEVGDWAEWEFEIKKPGTYAVEVQCGCGAGNGGSLIAVLCGNDSLEWKVPETGHFQNMIYLPIGDVTLEAGKQKLEVRPQKKSNFAIMDIRKIVLRRKSEEAIDE